MFLQLQFEDNVLKNAIGNFIEKAVLCCADHLLIYSYICILLCSVPDCSLQTAHSTLLH